MSKTTDMTVGSPARLILAFAFPLFLTNLGQQFYMIADASIVGRGVGVKALAAVGACDWIYWLLLWAVMGFTHGFGIFVARYFGEKNYRVMNRCIAMSAILSLGLGGVPDPGGAAVCYLAAGVAAHAGGYHARCGMVSADHDKRDGGGKRV